MADTSEIKQREPCSHEVYIQITGKTNDRCVMDLKQQPSINDRKYPLHDRPHQTVYIPTYEDPSIMKSEGYPPEIPGLGSCDSLAFRMCIACHEVLEVPNMSLEQWMYALRERTEDSDDNDQGEDDGSGN
jgi:hypothetical protein